MQYKQKLSATKVTTMINKNTHTHPIQNRTRTRTHGHMACGMQLTPTRLPPSDSAFGLFASIPLISHEFGRLLVLLTLFVSSHRQTAK